MSEFCLVCSEALPDNASYPTCSECNYGYHLGSCSGLTKAAFKSKDDAMKKTWKCQTCVVSAARSNQSAGGGLRDEKALEKVLIEINEKLAQLPIIQSRVDALFSVKETVNKLEHSIEHLSEQYDTVLAELKKQSAEITSLRKKVEIVESTNSTQEVSELKKQVNALEQYSRRHNLEIQGMPVVDKEDLLGRMNQLANKLRLPALTRTDLEALHRLPAKPSNNPAILVRFTSRVLRDEWMSKRTELRDAKLAVQFRDNVTQQNKKLLWMMKAKAREMHYDFVWQKDGKLFVRKASGQRALCIECEADLDKIA